MSVGCLFLDDDQGCCCRVLRDAGAGALQDGVADHLKERYCESARFISCPIYMRLRRKLDAVQALHDPTVPASATESSRAAS
ncbi:MAG: hypothetical protein MUF54_04515 [Polyangiaceae bacterium]|jgi:hypothetical protein|nr:hypothetical protein [Polyangiaceae bacterium]